MFRVLVLKWTSVSWILFGFEICALDKVVEAMRYEVYQWNVEVCSLHLGDIKNQNR